ncbi:MAG: N-acetylmuramoyl-L-alanine amidase [Lachnospiraceae bacterium]|nr:N-acetylmuramoyl-L-alanine amidase [Lachnospiraceae bacterium]MCI9148892.1 N-acetylmuramoyl-L-alanine amidase [Lachnospiraceae bacterium]
MNAEEARRRRAIQERRRRRRRKRTLQILRRVLICVAAVALVVLAVRQIRGTRQQKQEEQKISQTFEKKVADAPDFDVQLLTPNPYSRPQRALEEIKGIVIHYTANPGTTAQQNHDYFEGLKDSKLTKASSHFIVGIEGEIIQCIPSSEISYASNDRNKDTISIEVCHQDETGEFSKETYQALVHLTAWLCGKFDLTTEQVIRHYDVTGKKCPLYFVDHPSAWEEFIEDVQKYIKEHGAAPEAVFSYQDPFLFHRKVRPVKPETGAKAQGRM